VKELRHEGSGNYLQTNRKHWDVIAARGRQKKAAFLEQIRDGAPYLEEVEPKIAPYLKDIKGKNIIVLQFGDGLVMLACAKNGAVVTGVDFSREQVRLAREAAAYCGVDVRLVEADCQNLPENVAKNHFDFAVAECGIFIWTKNLDAWMRSAYRVLRIGGKLVVSDFHPLSIIAEEKNRSVAFRKSYFDQGAKTYEPEFWGDEENAPPAVEFLWKLSDIINAAIQAGFKINRVEEYYVEQKTEGVPLLPTDFLLVATKG
jgi:ubiquinone/menaquinone biosynthesis C-methylase UbiE